MIYFDDKLVYIGQGQNIFNRLNQHLKLRRYSSYWDSKWGSSCNIKVKYKPSTRYGDWAMIELRLLRRLKPPFNKRQTLRG